MRLLEISVGSVSKEGRGQNNFCVTVRWLLNTNSAHLEALCRAFGHANAKVLKDSKENLERILISNLFYNMSIYITLMKRTSIFVLAN